MQYTIYIYNTRYFRVIVQQRSLKWIYCTMVFGEDFLLPLKSLASLYHRVEESHLKEGK